MEYAKTIENASWGTPFKTVLVCNDGTKEIEVVAFNNPIGKGTYHVPNEIQSCRTFSTRTMKTHGVNTLVKA